MIQIADSMNTYNGALRIIESKEYTIGIVEYEDSYDWIASKTGFKLIASDPLRLLSIIILAETFGSKYNESERDIYDEILEKFLGE